MQEQFLLASYQGMVDRALAEAAAKSYAARIWSRNSSLWKQDPQHKKIIENALGWLTVAEDMKPKVSEIGAFVETMREKEYTTACLLGMGGSSLCPEVCATTFGTKPGYLRLIVLDTTDPASILSAEESTDLPHTLFLVSSKSGGTIESASLHKYFYEKLREVKGDKAGENFSAITDPGTSLERLAHEQGFLRVFLNPKDIGGRYSALSYFGLVPMALIGLDLNQILERALLVAQACRNEIPAGNPGLRLGVTLGALARQGRDKVTFHLAPEISAFGYWVEQLIAESTGKEGVGILPVEGEALEDLSLYCSDRVFVHVGIEGKEERAAEARLLALEKAGHPVLRWVIRDKLDIGGEFFLWEFATAAAGAVLGINAFDQPNVQESKDNTQRLIREYQATGRLSEGEPIAREAALSLYCDFELNPRTSNVGTAASPGRLREELSAFLNLAVPGDYCALMAYIKREPATTSLLDCIRRRIREKLRATTTLGYGPRFLHSTGQLHKGGANNGIFIQITADNARDVPIPGESYSFGTLKEAQASGDLQSLVQHGRRAVRLHISGDLHAGLNQIYEAVM
jgi:glucose-6-phosphate isomerase